eukprot:598711-Prymnesium_polylepis.1
MKAPLKGVEKPAAQFLVARATVTKEIPTTTFAPRAPFQPSDGATAQESCNTITRRLEAMLESERKLRLELHSRRLELHGTTAGSRASQHRASSASGCPVMPGAAE